MSVLSKWLALKHIILPSLTEYFWLLILQIISDLLHFKGSHKHEFDSRWKSFNLVKKSMENRVRKKKSFYTLLSSVLFLSSEGGKYITSDIWLNTGFTVSLQCIMLNNVFAASWQKAAHQSSANRQSHAPAWGELILKRQVFCMPFYYHFSFKIFIYQLRKLTMEGCQYRSIHQELMRDLLRLSTSTYSQVSSREQESQLNNRILTLTYQFFFPLSGSQQSSKRFIHCSGNLQLLL